MTEPAPSGERQRVMARIASVFFLVGSAVTVLAVVFPHSPQANINGFWMEGIVTAVAGVLLLRWGDRLPAWSFQPIIGFTSVLVALSLFFNGERDGGPAAVNEVLYLWIALYSGYFFTRAQVVSQLAFAAATYAGALVLIHPGEVGFSRWFITVGMLSVAAFVVHSLKRRNEGLIVRLSVAARSDPLTGLLNRQGFGERFEIEIERARRTERPLTLVMADLDHFKMINDRLGHPAGDAALLDVGRILTRGIRRIDTAARLGGDEFALILPAVEAERGLALTKRLRREIALAADRDRSPLTMSFGIVEFPLHGVTQETLVHAADQMLYEAKRRGRDQTVIHGSSRGANGHLAEAGFIERAAAATQAP